jgi:CheY-like chemotaxis protein
MPDPKPVILVVEDHPVILMGAVALIIEAGFEALEARSADEAISILEGRSDIQLVFTTWRCRVRWMGSSTHYIRDRWPPVKLMVASGRTIIDECHLQQALGFFQTLLRP